MRLKTKQSNRRIIDIRASEDNTPRGHAKPPLWKFDAEMELDVRVTIDIERDRLRTVDKNAARRIVANAENNLMNLLKSKEAVNCLKTR